MYLSPCVSPSPYLAVTSLLPMAARRSLPPSLSHFPRPFLSVVPSTRSFHLSSVFVFLPFHRLSKPLYVYSSLIPVYVYNTLYTYARVYTQFRVSLSSLIPLSLFLSLRLLCINSHLLHLFLRPPLLPLLASGVSLHCTRRYIRIYTTHTNDMASQPRRIGPSVLRALTPTSPLAYCFREFDEILPRDANVSPCTFFSTRQLVIRS